MWRVCLLLLGGCQIIINHNTFETGFDADTNGMDSKVGEDAPPPVVGAAVVTAQRDAAEIVVVGRVRWVAGEPEIDGDWPGVTGVTMNGKNDVTVSLVPTEHVPICACRSEGTGPEANACVISNELANNNTPTHFVVWSEASPAPDYTIDFACVSLEKPDGSAKGRLDWPGATAMSAAGARFGGGSVHSQEGAWLSAGSDGNLTFEPGVFSQTPACFTTPVADGDVGGRIASISVDGFSTAPWGSNSASFEEVLCLGPNGGDLPGRVISPFADGAFFGAENMNRDTMGSGWSMSFDNVSTGRFDELPSPNAQPAYVGGEPHCACSPVSPPGDTRQLGCQLVSVPTSTIQQYRVFDHATGQGVDLRPNLVCEAAKATD